jgi:hypothetical protein
MKLIHEDRDGRDRSTGMVRAPGNFVAFIYHFAQFPGGILLDDAQRWIFWGA